MVVASQINTYTQLEIDRERYLYWRCSWAYDTNWDAICFCLEGKTSNQFAALGDWQTRPARLLLLLLLVESG